MYKTILSIAFFALTLLGAWVAGFDFNHRGEVAFIVFVISLVFASLGMGIGSSLDDMNEFRRSSKDFMKDWK